MAFVKRCMHIDFMQKQSFVIGSETLSYRIHDGEDGVLVERESVRHGKGSTAKLTQVLNASAGDLDSFLEADPHAELTATVRQMVNDEQAHRHWSKPSAVPLEESGISDAIHSVSQSADESVLITRARQIVAVLGGTTAFFYMCDRDDTDGVKDMRLTVITPQGAGALQQYVSRLWYATDPFLMHASRSFRTSFSSNVGLFERLDGSWREMADFARNAGMKSWIVTPVHDPRTRRFGVLTVANDTLPAEGGEERFRKSQLYFHATAYEMFGWYMNQARSRALAASKLNTIELQILDVVARGGTLEIAAELVGISKTSVRDKILPDIRNKLTARNIEEAVRKAMASDLLAAASDRKVAYVIHSKRWGIFLREDFGVPFWSKLNPNGIDAAVVFPDAAKAEEYLAAHEHGDDCELVRVDIHHTASTATVDECALSGLPAWDTTAVSSGGPADESGTWGSIHENAATRH